MIKLYLFEILEYFFLFLYWYGVKDIVDIFLGRVVGSIFCRLVIKVDEFVYFGL